MPYVRIEQPEDPAEAVIAVGFGDFISPVVDGFAFCPPELLADSYYPQVEEKEVPGAVVSKLAAMASDEPQAPAAPPTDSSAPTDPKDATKA